MTTKQANKKAEKKVSKKTTKKATKKAEKKVSKKKPVVSKKSAKVTKVASVEENTITTHASNMVEQKPSFFQRIKDAFRSMLRSTGF